MQGYFSLHKLFYPMIQRVKNKIEKFMFYEIVYLIFYSDNNLIRVSLQFSFLYFLTCDSLHEILQSSPSHRNFLSPFISFARRSVMDWCGRTPTRAAR